MWSPKKKEPTKRLPSPVENENDVRFALQRALQLAGVRQDKSADFVDRIIKLVNGYEIAPQEEEEQCC